MARARRSKTVLLVMGVLMATVASTIVLLVPREAPDSVLSRDQIPDAVAKVRITIDSIDAARGSMKLRVAMAPGAQPVPPDGVTLVTDLDNLAPIKLMPGGGSQEGSTDLAFERGDISAYPFDTYAGSISMRVVRGTAVVASTNPTDEVPAEFLMIDSSVGFDGSADLENQNLGFTLGFQLHRQAPIVAWASVMMAIFWILTFAVMSVTAVVVLGLREWESRHLAWLGAMIFAFASFRATAPGSPPVGVYLDYASFFWAEALVALSLVTLVVFFLVGMRDPEPPAVGADPTQGALGASSDADHQPTADEGHPSPAGERAPRD